MSNPTVQGQLCISLIDSSLTNKGSLGVVVRLDKNTFVGQDSSIVVWDSDKYAEYLVSDIGVELTMMDQVTSAVSSLDFTKEMTISEFIRNSFFRDLFKDLKSRDEIQKLLP
jgi:hypothetical protein